MRRAGLVLAVLALGLLLAGAAGAADGPPWTPDYSTPEGTVLTQCMAKNLPEGRREIMERAYSDTDGLPDIMVRQERVMCRVAEVKPVHGAVDPSVVLPDRAQVILEEWDPVAGYSEKNIFRRWFSLRRVGNSWKITDWGVVNDTENPSDDADQLPAGPNPAGEGK